jgi:hypothetical protein
MNLAQQGLALLKAGPYKGMTNKAIEAKCGIGNGLLGRCEKGLSALSTSTIEKLAKGAGRKPHIIFKRDSK